VDERVLLIEDDSRLAAMVDEYLGKAGFHVLHADSGARGLALHGREPVDVVILDLMLPDADGLDICRQIRARSDSPILMLTARGDPMDRVVGLEMGADDYLPKPFAFKELAARVAALGRRSRPATPPILERAGIRLDPHRMEVFRDGHFVPLSRKEFAVLAELLRADGAAVSAEQLLEKAWDEHTDPFTNAVRITILKLRRKLGEPPILVTEPGVGYRIP
jgi:DNA-binding response OmpR family regulator